MKKKFTLYLAGLFMLTGPAFSQSKTTMDMTTEEKKKLVQDFITLMNTHQVDRFGEVIASDYQQHNAMVKPGLAGIQEGATWFASVFPDAHGEADDILVEGDKVVARFSWTGTHKGEFFGIPATGKKVTWTGADWWRIENGKLAEHWDVVDWSALLQQLKSQ